MQFSKKLNYPYPKTQSINQITIMTDSTHQLLQKKITNGSQKEILLFLSEIERNPKLNPIITIFSSSSVEDYFNQLTKSICESFDNPDILTTLYHCTKFLPCDAPIETLFTIIIKKSIYTQTNKTIYNKNLNLYCGYNKEDIYKNYLLIALNGNFPHITYALYQITASHNYASIVIPDILINHNTTNIRTLDILLESYHPTLTQHQKYTLFKNIFDTLFDKFPENINFAKYLKQKVEQYYPPNYFAEYFNSRLYDSCRKANYALIDFLMESMGANPNGFTERKLYVIRYTVFDYILISEPIDIIQYLLEKCQIKRGFSYVPWLLQLDLMDKLFLLLFHQIEGLLDIPPLTLYQINSPNNFYLNLNQRNKKTPSTIFKNYFNESLYNSRLHLLLSTLQTHLISDLSKLTIQFL